MEYIVSGTNPIGAVSSRCDTPVNAVKRAVEMMGTGMANVTIIAPDGEVFTSDRFAELYRKTRGTDANRT
jgi:3-oxoacyl-(acyl-carrier-protein) synthase